MRLNLKIIEMQRLVSFIFSESMRNSWAWDKRSDKHFSYIFIVLCFKF